MMMRWYDEQTYEYDGSRMSQTEYNLKAIMYSAYDTPHKLYNIRGN